MSHGAMPTDTPDNIYKGGSCSAASFSELLLDTRILPHDNILLIMEKETLPIQITSFNTNAICQIFLGSSVALTLVSAGHKLSCLYPQNVS